MMAWLSLAFGLTLAIFGFLLFYLLVDVGLELARRVRKRRAQRWQRVAAYLPWARAREAAVPVPSHPPSGHQRAVSFLPAVGGMAAALHILPHSALMAAYIAVTGGAISYYLLRRQQVQRSTSVVTDLSRLITVFQSRYQIYQTIIPALEAAAEKVSEPLRGWLEQTVQGVHAGQSIPDALDRLETRQGDPYLSQFVTIIRHAHQADSSTVDQVLDDLDQRLREREKLLAEQRITLATVTITARVLQLLGLTAVLIALVILGDFYTASWSRQGIFIVVTAAMLFTAAYFDQRILSLRERVL